MILAAPLLVGAAVILTAFVAYALQHMTETWARPTIEVSKTKRAWWQYLVSPTARNELLSRAFHASVAPAVRYVTATVSRWALAHVRPAARWLTGLNGVQHMLFVQMQGLAHDTAVALDRAHDIWIPRSLHTAKAFAKHGIDALHHALSRDLALLRRYALGIDRLARHTIIPRVQRLTHSVDHAIPREIGRIRTRVRVLEGLTIKGLRRRIRLLERLLVPAVFAAAVTRAFRSMGLGPLRCASLRRIFARHGCNLFRAFEDLTALVIDALLISDLCQIMWVMQGAARAAAPAINHLAEGIGELLQCQNADRPGALPVTWNDPPPPTTTVNL